MSETIEQVRQVALDQLNATQKEIEHGLELHANSVVCDTYGFAPRAAVNGDVIKELVESGASETEIVDATEEASMTRYVWDPAEREEYKRAWEAAGVTCVFQNAGVESQAPLEIIKRLARFTYAADMMRDFMVRATRPEDIVAAKEQGKHCFYMSSNGVPLKQQWNSLEEELGYIRIFFQLGTRMMHLTYNRRNMIGDGCAEPSNAGLSDFGRAVVAEMNRVGVIVDTAHSGQQTSLEAAQVSNAPIVASHSGVAAINGHIRCKTDEVIRAIVDSGGYIGICAIPRFLGRTGDIQALLDHVDYVARKFGPDHVTIGTDVAYSPSRAASERQKIPARRRVRNRWESFWPPGENDPRWRKAHMVQSLAWTNWPIFTVGLVQRGYSDEDIQKIIGGNMLRVAQAVLRMGEEQRR